MGAEGLGGGDALPEAACAHAFTQRPFQRIDFRTRAMLHNGGALSFVDEGSVRAREDQIRLGFQAKFGEDLPDTIARFTLPSKISPGRDLLDLYLATAAE